MISVNATKLSSDCRKFLTMVPTILITILLLLTIDSLAAQATQSDSFGASSTVSRINLMKQAAEQQAAIAAAKEAMLISDQNAVEAASDKKQSENQSAAARSQPAQPVSTSALSISNSADDRDKQTTAAQVTQASGHETIYSDQRFANLFARRNNVLKRITPSEQVKPKPTLPSFIKSIPDPKQFTTPQVVNQENGGRSNSQSSFTSQRLQQQNQVRVNQQKKVPAITSTSASLANNKRASTINNNNSNANITNSNSKASLNGAQKSNTASNTKSFQGTSNLNSPVSPSSNNPFIRPQGSNNDPSNVIAMARKRLLASNALESAKLKQQQQSKPN